MTDRKEEKRFQQDWTAVEEYSTFLQEPSRPPSRGGNARALHVHRLTIEGERYSFLARGSKKWAFKSDVIRFQFIWKDGKYRNIIRDTLEARDKNGKPIIRGDRTWKATLRTAETRMPGSRRERRD